MVGGFPIGRNSLRRSAYMSCLLLQQVVDAFEIVERVIDEETQFWYYAQLVSYSLSEVVTYCGGVLLYVLQQFVTTLRGEDAEVCSADAEVWRYLHSCYAYHYAVHLACLALKDETELLLQQS